jgi:transposase
VLPEERHQARQSPPHRSRLVVQLIVRGVLHHHQLLPSVTQAQPLLRDVPARCMVADKAYDARALCHAITAAGAKVVIPPRANRREPILWSKAIYRHRNLVERFFCRIKHYRRIATRYDKLAERFASFVCLVGAIVCMR